MYFAGQQGLKLNVAPADEDQLYVQVFSLVKSLFLADIERQVEKRLRRHADFESLRIAQLSQLTDGEDEQEQGDLDLFHHDPPLASYGQDAE